MKNIKLNNENFIPKMGMGTWMMRPSQSKELISAALEKGITFFDTAQQYNSETFIGKAIKDSGVSREKIFIATKVWITNTKNKEDFFTSIKQSLRRLETNYIDLLLLHWSIDETNMQAYKWLIEAQEKGLTKNIGLSNFDHKWIKKLIDETGVVPQTVHYELQLHNQQKENVKFAQENNILVQAYSVLRPLIPSKAFTFLIEEFNDKERKIIDEMAKKYDITPHQFLLAYAFNKGFNIFPKMSSPSRMDSNLAILELKISKEDIEFLDTLSRVDYKTIDFISQLKKPTDQLYFKPPLLYEKYFKEKRSKVIETSASTHEKFLVKLDKKMAKKDK